MGANQNLVRMEGLRFGSLTVLRREGSTPRNNGGAVATWRCRCDCGQTVVVRGYKLRQGAKKACGINGHHYRTAFVESTKSENRIWNGMLQRCYNPKSKAWSNYGGRGIKVCKRWKESFENFLNDMGPRPSPNHSIDRHPDMNGNYEPTNCRWATPTEQGLNRRDTVLVVFRGKTITVSEYAKEIGVYSGMIRRRLVRGWSVEDALTTPSGGNCRSRKTHKNEYPEDWMTGAAFKEEKKPPS